MLSTLFQNRHSMPLLDLSSRRSQVSRTDSLPNQSAIDLIDFNVEKRELKLPLHSAPFVMPPPIVHYMPASSTFDSTPDAGHNETELFRDATNSSLFDADAAASASALQKNAVAPNCITSASSCPVAHFVQVVADSYAYNLFPDKYFLNLHY